MRGTFNRFFFVGSSVNLNVSFLSFLSSSSFHHVAALADIELTTPFQYSLSVIAAKRSSLGMPVLWLTMSGKVSFRDRPQDDGCLHRTNDEMSSSEALAQWPAKLDASFSN